MTSFNRVGLCAVWLEARRNLVFVHAPGLEPLFESGAQQPKMNAENDQAHGPIICFMALEEWLATVALSSALTSLRNNAEPVQPPCTDSYHARPRPSER